MKLLWKRLGWFVAVWLAVAMFAYFKVFALKGTERPEQVLSTNTTVGSTTAQPQSTSTVTTKSVNNVPTSPPTNTYQQSIATLNGLGSKYGISIGVNAPVSHNLGSATWQPVTEKDKTNLKTFTKYLSEEFNKYPVGFVSKSGLKRINIVKNLSISGQARAAMPDPVIDDAVYYDISSIYTSNSTYMRNVIHHEFDHLIEFNDFGSYAWNDTNWKACNTTDFKYGNGGWAAYSDPTYASTKHPQNGFVTGYGTYGIEEDKAEIFAELMTNKSNLIRLDSSDSFLACKVNLYRQYMSNLGLIL